MNRYSKFVAAATVVLFTGITAHMAKAQNRSIDTATIPFSFTVENHVLSAGDYEIVKLSTHSLRLHKVDGGESVDLLVFPIDQPTKSGTGQLRFSQYGTRYFLNEFSPSAGNGIASAVRCIHTKVEKEASAAWASSRGARSATGQQEVAINVMPH